MIDPFACQSGVTIALDEGWEFASTPAGAVARPEELAADISWLPAQVPGTVAASLQQSGLWRLDAARDLHDQDYWYRTRFTADGKRALRFHGLATLAQVWLNGSLVLETDNMFVAQGVDIDAVGCNQLFLCFRSLFARLEQFNRRARWRPQMIAPNSLRFMRTTVLGHMPGWCPPVHVVGPWRRIEHVESKPEWRITDMRLLAELDDRQRGILRVAFKIQTELEAQVTIECADETGAMNRVSDGSWVGELVLDQIQPWWPHTHGAPRLYPVRVRLGASVVELGNVGFRRIELDRGPDGRGFIVKVNGTRVFCRGACWTSANVVQMTDTRAAYEKWLLQARAANMNMIRVGGATVYEGDAFYRLCDELGLLVWQDFMFANFDYPTNDSNFEKNVRREAEQFLARTQNSPCLAILCGGSEVAQQAAMLGLGSEFWTNALFDDWLPHAVRSIRPDVPYVANTPSGGELPFVANAGVTHYYGVGAYLRPLDDARRADVRFASECLAFANVPERTTLSNALDVPAVHHPLWKQRVPRDNGASWDFEDVRDHYLQTIYGVDPASLRREQPERYLDVSRAVTAEVMEMVFAEWRRKQSSCSGGLVWTFQDLWPGAGWGIVDSLGEPKAAWYALRRAFRPVQVVMSDEGVNGLAINVINDTGKNYTIAFSFSCWNDSSLIVKTERVFTVFARDTLELWAAELLGKFFDTTYAYRFGPPAHTLAVATIRDVERGDLIAESYYFPRGRVITPRAIELSAEVQHRDSQWLLLLKTDQLAQSVQIEDEHFRPEDNWFHLAPRSERFIRLIPRTTESHIPRGEVRALNSQRTVRYRVTQ